MIGTSAFAPSRRASVAAVAFLSYLLLGATVPGLPSIAATAQAAGETCNGLPATIVGSGVINGTAGNDVIVSGNSTNTINGNGGNDTICGGSGTDHVFTGAGNDWVSLGQGTNDLTDTGGTNTVTAGNSSNTITTGDGDDTITAGNGTNVIVAGHGKNKVTTGNGSDTITTGDGDDIISAGNGTNGSAGNRLKSGGGNDSITGGSGADHFDGGAGIDYCDVGGGSNSTINCEATPGEGVVSIVKDAQPNSAQDFTFGGLGGFTLDDDADGTLSNTYTSVRSVGTHVVTENMVSGWTLQSIVCTDPSNGSSVNVGTRTATIDLDAGEVVTCTFLNALADMDGDGVTDSADNCPAVSNSDQADEDEDDVGDACDNDADNDTIQDDVDNCPYDANPEQEESDEPTDGIGDACSTSTTLLVTPSLANGWTVTDEGNDPTAATHAFVFGPAVPPLGDGSLKMTVPNAEDYSIARNTSFAGVKLADLQALTYDTYVNDFVNGQAPVLSLKLDNDNNGSVDDALYFEPVYQNGTYGGDVVPNQCVGNESTCAVEGEWQHWNALAGGWWTSSEGFGGPPLHTIAGYLALHPDATIVNDGSLGGVRVFVGAGVPATASFDKVVIQVNGDRTTYDFEPTPVEECVSGSTFDTFTDGSVNGQDGWKATGTSYDHEVLPNNFGYPTFGCKTLRISNAVTSGSFGDWIFSKPLADEAGETAATNGGESGGTRQNRFEMTLDLGTTVFAEQPGLQVSVSPDRGDGSRMSFLRFRDNEDGIDIDFVDVQGTGSPANFVTTTIAEGLDRTVPHTINLVIDFVDGPSNDVVTVSVDGTPVHTGTSWENYYRYDAEASAEQSTRTVDSVIFQARSGGGTAPDTLGEGFLFDNVSLESSTVALPAPTMLGWNVEGESATFGELPVDLACSEEGVTIDDSQNSLSQNWTTVPGSNIKYIRRVSANGGGSWNVLSGMVFTTPHMNGWFSFGSGEAGTYLTQVMAFNDVNGNNAADDGAWNISDWSNDCEITYAPGSASSSSSAASSAASSATTSAASSSAPEFVYVTIAKYVDGEHATAESTSSAIFNMIAEYQASNLLGGAASSDPYTIGPVGNGTSEAYEARTTALATGANYGTYEVQPEETCTEEYPFQLVGYTSGNTSSEAQAAEPTLTYPSFTNMTSDKFVIVWNETCDGSSSSEASSESSVSSAASSLIAAPGAPVFWTEEDDDQIKIEWKPVAGADSYTVYRSADDTAYPALFPPVLEGTTFYINNVVPGEANWYKVTATNAGGTSTLDVDPKFADTMDIVIDDDARDADFNASGTVSKTGSWGAYSVDTVGAEQILSFAVGGDNYSLGGIYDGSTFSWTTDDELTGMYDVYVTYICDSSRGTAAYDVYDDATKLTVSAVLVNQGLQSSDGAPCGSQGTKESQPFWVKLGSYAFDGGNGEVRLVDGEGNYILADAVAFERTGDLPSSSAASSVQNSASSEGGEGSEGSQGSLSSGASAGSEGSTSSAASSEGSVITQCVPTGLLAHWRLDDNAGTTALDSTGNGHHGTLTGGTWTTPGANFSPNVSALSFDGDDVVSNGDAAFSLDNDEFTVSTFLKSTNGDRAVLGHFNTTESGFRGWGLYVYGNDRVNFFGYGDQGLSDTSHAATVLDGQWHHVAGVYSRNGSQLTIRTYVDGILVGTHTATVGDIGLTTDMLLGKYTFQPNLIGSLDDVRIYDRELDTDEIEDLSTGCGTASSSASSEGGEGSEGSEGSQASAGSSQTNEEGGSSAGGEGGGEGNQSFQAFTITDDAPGGNGARRGQQTNVAFNVANFLAKHNDIGGNLAPGAFGGGPEVPLTDDEVSYICAMQRALPAKAGKSFYQKVAEHMSEIMNREVDFLVEQLKNKNLCASVTASLLPTTTSEVTKSMGFPVDAEGFPVSSNDTWNSCIRGGISLREIRGNVDRDGDNLARDCSAYRQKDQWRHPDLNMFFGFDRRTKKISLPVGYFLEKEPVASR